MIELKITLDPTIGQVQVSGNAVDSMPVVALNMLEAAAQAIRTKAAQVELRGQAGKIIPATIVPKVNGGLR